jgi:hypothetical protein
MPSSQPKRIAELPDGEPIAFVDQRYGGKSQPTDRQSGEEEGIFIPESTLDTLPSRIEIPISTDNHTAISILPTTNYLASVDTKTEGKLGSNSPSGSSKGSDTPISSSDNDEDWDEDEMTDSLHEIRVPTLPQAGQTHQASSLEHLINPMLTPMKRGLVDRLMNEFWAVFNQDNDAHR